MPRYYPTLLKRRITDMHGIDIVLCSTEYSEQSMPQPQYHLNSAEEEEEEEAEEEAGSQ